MFLNYCNFKCINRENSCVCSQSCACTVIHPWGKPPWLCNTKSNPPMKINSHYSPTPLCLAQPAYGFTATLHGGENARTQRLSEWGGGERENGGGVCITVCTTMTHPVLQQPHGRSMTPTPVSNQSVSNPHHFPHSCSSWFTSVPVDGSWRDNLFTFYHWHRLLAHIITYKTHLSATADLLTLVIGSLYIIQTQIAQQLIWNSSFSVCALSDKSRHLERGDERAGVVNWSRGN